MIRKAIPSLSLLALLALTAGPAAAQAGLTLPPDGDNQRSTATQQMGLVRVTLDYSSPDVHGPNGEDRKGKIWGGLVPYGMTNLGFGSCGDQCPWRGGANENTVFTTNYDVKIQGKPLPAGSYGLHFLPGPDEWTVIFSKTSTAWGSFFYDAKEDALRVQAKPEKSEYHEWLTYEFTNRHPDKMTVALKWEELQVPFTVSVDKPADLYVANMREELRSEPGFNWQGWSTAAQYAVANKVGLEEGLVWANRAVTPPPIGQPNFTTLSTLSRLQAANGKADEAKKSMELALAHPTASPFDIHGYARQLQAEGQNEEALKVFELNAKKYPNTWPVQFGLARGLAGVGKKAEAIEAARKSLAQAPDPASKQGVENFIKQLEGK